MDFAYFVANEAFRDLAENPHPHSPKHTLSGCATFSPSDAEKGVDPERGKSLDPWAF